MQRYEAIRYRALGLLRSVLGLMDKSHVLAFAFVLGIWVNALSESSEAGLVRIARQVYDIGSRPAAWLTAVATLIVVIRPVLRLSLRLLARSTEDSILLSRLLADYVDQSIRLYHRGRIAWGAQLVLQSCPNIEDGWRPLEVRIRKDPSEFQFAEDNRGAYELWLRSEEAQRLLRSGYVLRLLRNPASSVDHPTLTLEVQPVLFAQAAFFSNNRAPVAAVRQWHIERALSGEIDFPHAVSLHAVIATADDWVLLTRRSTKVFYHPTKWSCSIERTLKLGDLDNPEPDRVTGWVQRMLLEELGLTYEETSASHTRVLAAFMETDILNCSIAALITLPCNREKVDAVLSGRPRADYEFQEWAFIRWSEFGKELVQPSRSYHPTSGLRMFLAGVVKYGVHAFGLTLQNEHRRTWRTPT